MVDSLQIAETTESSNDRFDYRFRIQVPENSLEGILLRYLMEEGNQVYSHKEMVLAALRAYWLPHAYANAIQRGELSLSEGELQTIATDAVEHLGERMEIIRRRFLSSSRFSLN
jgi:hypothetical protein